LALGIGANAAIFSIVDWLLLRPLPVRDPGQMATIWQQQGNQAVLFPGSSVPDYRELSRQSTAVFDDVFGYELDLVGLRSRDNKAERVITNYVTGNFFSALGLKPSLGGLILPSEGTAPVARQFGRGVRGRSQASAWRGPCGHSTWLNLSGDRQNQFPERWLPE